MGNLQKLLKERCRLYDRMSSALLQPHIMDNAGAGACACASQVHVLPRCMCFPSKYASYQSCYLPTFLLTCMWRARLHPELGTIGYSQRRITRFAPRGL